MSTSRFAPLDLSPPSSSSNPRRVAYYYDPDVGNYVYYLGHPMKPHRIRMAHNLIVNYGLCDEEPLDAPESSADGARSFALNGGTEGVDGSTGGMEVDGRDEAEKRYERQVLTGSRGRAMQVFRPRRANRLDMTRFHTDEYIDLLEKVTPETSEALTGGGVRCLTGEDCPPFEGLFEFCSISAGGSIAAAQRLNSGAADVAINWAGGLHHAKKTEASGFCYVNDIVLGILELLRIHPRVLYIDVDVHHGDGVEEAFYTTDRVMTASFHRFGEFFPGTGDVRDIGMKRGKGYAVNVPLRDGITDESFHSVFKPVIRHIIDFFRPGAIVLQMGADSLSGDKLGGFNMTLHGHAECAKFVKSFNVPVMMLGGGGYTTKNVARAWTYETAVMCGRELSEDLPYNQYMEYYGPRYKLEVLANNQDNHNPPEYLEAIKTKVLENLRDLPHAPGAQMQLVPKRGIGSLLGMDEGSDPEDEVETRIKKIMRKRQLNGHAGYSSGSESEDGDAVPNRRRGYVNPSGGRRTLPRRRNGNEEDDEEDDPCGVKRSGKRSFFSARRYGVPKIESVFEEYIKGKTSGIGINGVNGIGGVNVLSNGVIGTAGGSGSGASVVNGTAAAGDIVEAWNPSGAGSPMSVV